VCNLVIFGAGGRQKGLGAEGGLPSRYWKSAA